jgi:hypothetical protein
LNSVNRSNKVFPHKTHGLTRTCRRTGAGAPATDARRSPKKTTNYDTDKIDEYTLALLYLVVSNRHEGFGARAWKGFDWDTMNRLHKKGYTSNPIGKAKSVGMTEEGFLKAKELFERHFAKEK